MIGKLYSILRDHLVHLPSQNASDIETFDTCFSTLSLKPCMMDNPHSPVCLIIFVDRKLPSPLGQIVQTTLQTTQAAQAALSKYSTAQS